MPKYRYYRLDGAGHISRAEWLDATDDKAAELEIRNRELPVPSELWQGKRLVARIEPPFTG